MLSSEEMVMDSSGKMAKLLDFIKMNTKIDSTEILTVDELPAASDKTVDKIYLLNRYSPADSSYKALFDAEGDKTKMLDGAVGTVIPTTINWDNFYELKITGAYLPTGEIWTNGAAIISDNITMIGKNVVIKDNSNNKQGEYTILENGLFVVADVYGNCVIDKIEGKQKALYPTLLVTMLINNVYKWIDIINKKEVN